MNVHKEYNTVASFAILVSMVIFVLIAWYTIDIFLLTFAAVLFAIFLRTLNNLIQRIVYLPDTISMSLVILIIFTLFSAMIIAITPVIGEQMQGLSQDIAVAWDELKNILNFHLGSGLPAYQKMIEGNILPQGKNILIQFAKLFSTTFGLIGSGIVVIVMGIFLAYDPNTYKNGFINLFPSKMKKNALNIIESVIDILQGWIIGAMCSMLIIGILTTSGLWFLNIPMALTLGLLAAILTFIPNIGPIISAIPAILVAFVQSPIAAIYVISLYIIIQAIESYIITPLIQRKMIAQPPALVIFSQLIMGLLTGFLGLALATPLLAAVSVLVKKIYIEKDSNNDKI